MERLEFNQNNQITPFVLNWNFRLYIEEEYIKNMDFFFIIKEEALDIEVKCRFNKIFIDQSRQLSEKEFLLPAEFIDEDGNTRIVNVFFRGTTIKDIKIKELVLERMYKLSIKKFKKIRMKKILTFLIAIFGITIQKNVAQLNLPTKPEQNLVLNDINIDQNTSSGWHKLNDIVFSGDVPADVRVKFEINGKGYVGTGEGGGSTKKDFWEYDPSTDTWTQKANFPGSARWFAAGFVINGKGYLGTGSTTSSMNGEVADFYEYDPISDKWNSIAGFGGGVRANTVSFSIGNKGYVGLGYSTRAHNDLWEYDPVIDSWIRKADFPGAARGTAFSFVIDGVAYVGCGYNNKNNPSTFYPDVYAYEPDTFGAEGGGTWKRVADFGGGNRGHAGTFVINGMGYVTGGDFPKFTTVHRDLWKYNPNNNKWLQKEDFIGIARLTPDFFSLNNKGYVGGGANFGVGGGYQKDFYMYTESCDSVFANFICTEHPNSVLTVNFFADDIFDHSAVYTWDFGDGHKSSEQNPIHTYNSSGIYIISLTIKNKCSSHTFSKEISLLNTNSNPQIINASDRERKGRQYPKLN